MSNSSNGKDQPKMRYNRLGSTGLRVSEICLGAMTFSVSGPGIWGLPSAQESDAHAMLDAFVADGGNFIDTADVYGSSEVVLGNWLAKQKDPKAFRRNVIIATKFKMSKPPHGLNDKGGNRKHIIDSVNDSLANLQTDYIDLYQIHSWDTACELRETLSALNDLIRQGKVHYIGASNFTAWQLQKAVDLQDKYGWDRFYTLQQQYSLLMRNIEWDSVEVCKNEGIGILPWSPLAGGWLSGKYKRGDHKPLEGGRVAWAESVGWGETGWDTKKSDQTYNIIEELEKIGKEVNQPVAAVALRWLIQKPGVSSTIIGATTIKQLEQNLAAAKFSLSDEQVERLNKVSETPLPYPFNVIKSTNS